MVMFNAASLKILIIPFLRRSVSGPDKFRKTAEPSSWYKPTFSYYTS